MLDPEFSPTALQNRVVLGAEQSDAVRLHGAITAALNLHSRSICYAEVFAPALDRLPPGARQRARDAVNAHLLAGQAEPSRKRRP